LLSNSRVAHHWGAGTLHYIRSPSPQALPAAPRSRAPAILNPYLLQRITDAAPGLSFEARTFAVMDLCDLRLRSVVLKERATAQVWRLARELSAQVIVLKDINVVMKVTSPR
jgi:hypothetical protein